MGNLRGRSQVFVSYGQHRLIGGDVIGARTTRVALCLQALRIHTEEKHDGL